MKRVFFLFALITLSLSVYCTGVSGSATKYSPGLQGSYTVPVTQHSGMHSLYAEAYSAKVCTALGHVAVRWYGTTKASVGVHADYSRITDTRSTSYSGSVDSVFMDWFFMPKDGRTVGSAYVLWRVSW